MVGDGRRRRAVEFAWPTIPKLDLLYFGTGNGDPWNRNLRSPGGGDNLYLSSIVALHAETGEFAWYYQTTPGDTWDFNSTAAHHPRRSEDRRANAPGSDAGAEERLLLCDRPRQRKADLGEEIRHGHTGRTAST